MSDLVERLRAPYPSMDSAINLMDDAADEIERLRKEVQRLETGEAVCRAYACGAQSMRDRCIKSVDEMVADIPYKIVIKAALNVIPLMDLKRGE